MTRPSTAEVGQLVHALRDPVGAFVIRLALLDDEQLTPEARHHLEAMLANVTRMTEALAELTKRFGLELGDSTPLAMISRENRRSYGTEGVDRPSA